MMMRRGNPRRRRLLAVTLLLACLAVQPVGAAASPCPSERAHCTSVSGSYHATPVVQLPPCCQAGVCPCCEQVPLELMAVEQRADSKSGKSGKDDGATARTLHLDAEGMWHPTTDASQGVPRLQRRLSQLGVWRI